MCLSDIKSSKTIANVIHKLLGLSLELDFVKVAQRKRLESTFLSGIPHSLVSKKPSASIRMNP